MEEVLLILLVSAALAWVLFLSGDRYLGYRKPSESDLRALKAQSGPLFLAARYSAILLAIAWAMAVAGLVGVASRYPVLGIALLVGSVAAWLSRVWWHIRLRLSK